MTHSKRSRDPLLGYIPALLTYQLRNIVIDCLTHRNRRSVQQISIEILSNIDKTNKTALVSDWIGIGRSSEYSVSNRFWKNCIVASLFTSCLLACIWLAYWLFISSYKAHINTFIQQFILFRVSLRRTFTSELRKKWKVLWFGTTFSFWGKLSL